SDVLTLLRALCALVEEQGQPQQITLFPYATLFRSRADEGEERDRQGERGEQPRVAHPGGAQHDEGEQGVEDGEHHHAVEVLVHRDRKSTRLNSSHVKISYAVFCLKKKIKSTSNERH